MKHIEKWVNVLPRNHLMSLSLTLHHAMVDICGRKKTAAAEAIGSLIGKSGHIVRDWRKSFFANSGSFPDSEQEKCKWQGVLWHNEELCEAACGYVRSDAVMRGKPNMTAISFCRWVNESLLPNSVLEPGFPQHIGVTTAQTWLPELGLEVLDKKKGVYIDGHERLDIDHRRKFLRKLVASGFLVPEEAPTDEAQNAFPADLETPSPNRRHQYYCLLQCISNH